MTDRRDYQHQYWQNYRQKNRRVYGAISEKDYQLIKYLADQNDRGVWTQIWLESCAYRKGERLLSQRTEDELRSLKIEIRRIGTNINQIAKHSNGLKKLLQDRQLLKNLEALENQLENAVRSFTS